MDDSCVIQKRGSSLGGSMVLKYRTCQQNQAFGNWPDTPDSPDSPDTPDSPDSPDSPDEMVHGVLVGPSLQHAPGARMTVV